MLVLGRAHGIDINASAKSAENMRRHGHGKDIVTSIMYTLHSVAASAPHNVQDR